MCKKLICWISFIFVFGLVGNPASADPFTQDGGLDGIVSIEAENFDENTPQGGHEWEFNTDPTGFSGKGFMRAVPDSGTNNNADYVTNAPRLDYEVNFVKTGIHYVWVRGMRTSGSDDSAHVGIDAIETGGGEADRIQAGGTNNTWEWSIQRRESLGPAQIEVTSSGVHVISVWQREDGWRFDKLVLTTNPDYTPTDLGPEESPRGPRLQAYAPAPEDGELYLETWVTLSWLAGETAVSHDVYFGENFADVNEGVGDTFRGNQTSTIFIVGFPGNPYPEGLPPGTTYYWRIDEVEADGATKYKGNVWSFTIPPQKAYDPNPVDGSKFIPTDVTLSWTAGLKTKLHYVYFGDDPDVVANATGAFPQPQTTYAPGPLELHKTYYWRVDEFDAVATHKGDVWSFTTTMEGLGTVIAERWENIATTDLNALKNDPRFPNDPDVTEVLTEFSWNGPDIDDYGGRIHGWVYVPATGDYTFWLNTDDQGELWLSRDDDSSNVQLIAQESTWAGFNAWGSGEEKSDPIALVGGEKYYIMALWKEGGGGDHCQVAWRGPAVPERTVIPGSNLSPYEPLNAYGASPTNGATDVTQTPILKWKPGLQAASHEVYFGTDADAVANATKASPEFKATKALGEESYAPGQLAWESTYYWRVDEVNNLNPASPWVGNVWSFTTAGFAIVDDFESYTDNDAANEAIWQHWIDGFGVASNGSQVGYLLPPYAEQTVVHSGRQSMPLMYNNIGGVTNSEAELKLASTRDWTVQGVTELALWFNGLPGSVGSFVEGPVGTYTITGSGADIWNNGPAGDRHDEFHYAYKSLTGAGSITARVVSVQNTNSWAKAGVMIRETLEGGSKHAFACVTPSNGVAAQGRQNTGGDSFNTNEGGITAPHWVKLERTASGSFIVSHSPNGTAWSPVAGATPQSITMGSNVYIGLALTSHDAALTCEAVFSNVTTTGNVSGQWQNQDIGITSNAAEPLYVAVSNAAGGPAVVANADPLAATIDAWTEWRIPLQVFADQGINLRNVDKIAIGLGSQSGMASAGGSGTVYIDDIRLYRP